MCTIVALLKPNRRDDVLFFENRDKPLEEFFGNDFRVIDSSIVGLYDYRSDGIAWGYALKTGIYTAVANVLGYEGPKSRGVLLKEVLSEAKSLKEALKIMAGKLSRGEYSAGVYLVGSRTELATIENYGEKTLVIPEENRVILTNQHTHISAGFSEGPSRARREFVKKYLQSHPEIHFEDLVRIATYHGRKYGICRHGHTLASVIIRLSTGEERPLIKYSIGPPCAGYSALKLNPRLV